MYEKKERVEDEKRWATKMEKMILNNTLSYLA